jgi:HSP20 family protein
MTRVIQKQETEHDVWTDLERSFDEMRSRVFDAFGLPALVPTTAAVDSAIDRSLHPARVDVSDAGTSYKIVAEVPGIPKEKLDIRIRGAQVEIRGESETAHDEKSRGKFVRRERAYAGYYRWLELPEPVVGSDAKAKVENGLLELELPKEHPTPSPSEVRVRVP